MRITLGITAALLLLGAGIPQGTTPGTPQPRLYCGTDQSGFNSMNGQLAVVRTNGPQTISPIKIFNLNFPLNGITATPDFLLAGQPEDVGGARGNIWRELSLSLTAPALLRTIPPGSNSFSSSCCNEQMVAVGDGTFYHAHYGDVIQQIFIDSAGQSEVLKNFKQSDVVGMATDGVQFWITNWDLHQVGTWDPATNTFTVVFTTPADAGALAWDTANGVLWVGMLGGSVIPYDATGKQLGPGFQPFGSISNTVDGLAFVPE